MIRRPPRSTRTDTHFPYTTLFRSAFVAAYVAIALGMPRIADMDEIITKWPVPWARNTSIAASDWARAPMKFVIAVSLLAQNLPVPRGAPLPRPALITIRSRVRSEEHTSELQSLMRISYAVFCLKKKTNTTRDQIRNYHDKLQPSTRR